MHQVTALIHVHTTASDGTSDHLEIVRQAARAGVDVVVLTDHDIISPGAGWHNIGGRKVLVMAGTEVTPRHNHLLVLDLERPLPKLRGNGIDGDPGRSLAMAAERGGWAALAHPLDPGMNFTSGGKSFALLDYSEIDCGGVELWNTLAAFKEDLTGPAHTLARIFMPRTFLAPPHAMLLNLWDTIGRRRRWTGFAGGDAHAFKSGMGWLPLRVYSYRRHMSLHTTGLWLHRPLSADSAQAQGQVIEALEQGRCFCASGRAKGLDCRIEHPDGRKRAVGSELTFEPGWTLKLRLPALGRVRLMRNGAKVCQRTCRDLRWPLDRPGVWRVEADRFRPPLGWRPWIYCNPFYLRG